MLGKPTEGLSHSWVNRSSAHFISSNYQHHLGPVPVPTCLPANGRIPAGGGGLADSAPKRNSAEGLGSKNFDVHGWAELSSNQEAPQRNRYDSHPSYI